MPVSRRLSLGLCGSMLAALHSHGARAQGALAPRAQAGQPPRVVASFSILADMARELAPAGTQVTALVGPDADAHVYEPRPADAQRLAQADLVLVNGLGFEGWITRMVQVSGYRGAVVVASQGITPRRAGRAGPGAATTDHAATTAHAGPAGHGPAGTDPHAWQDLALARRYADNLSQAFAQRWPGQRQAIGQRHAAYVARIGQLDQQVRTWLGAVPQPQRRVITSHDAFGYFAAAYGVEFLAPQGWGTHSEPSAAAVARLIRQIRQERVRAIFIENISDPRLVQRIAHESGVRVGATLYSDALSAPGGPAATYLQMMEHNARSLASALQA